METPGDQPTGLRDAPLIGFVPVRDLDAARRFYAEVLGLTIAERTPFALVADAGATMLRLTVVPALDPQPFTIAGWRVADIDAAVDGLVARGVAFTRYERIEQDARGVWTTPSGDRVAWFADPDGNTLSLTQFAAR